MPLASVLLLFIPLASQVYAAEPEPPPIEKRSEGHAAEEDGLLALYQPDDGGGQQALNTGVGSERSGAVQLTPSYQDALIDPDVAEDEPLSNSAFQTKEPSAWGARYWSLTTAVQHERDAGESEPRDNAGLAASFGIDTLNYGHLYVELVSVYEQDYEGGNTLQEQTLHSGTLSQRGLPVGGQWLMNNLFGVLRLRDGMAYQNRRNQLRYPVMQGFSSSVFRGREYSFSVAFGELGQYRSSVVRGFEREAGDVAILTATRRFDERISLSAEYWQVRDDSDFVETDMSGGALSVTYQLDTLSIALQAIANEQQRYGYTLDVSKHWSRYHQNIGAYWYDDELRWVSDAIQNDTFGAFYRGSYHSGRSRSFLNLEWRRNGIESKADRSDIAYLSLGSHYRIGAFDSVSAHLYFRDQQRSSAGVLDKSRDYRLRGSYDVQHSEHWGSRWQLMYSVSGERDGSDENDSLRELSYNLSWHEDGQRFGLELGYANQKNASVSYNRPLFGMSWDRDLSADFSLSFNSRYQLSESNGADNEQDTQSWSGSVNMDWRFARQWELGVQGSYNEFVSEFETGLAPGVEDLEEESSSVALYLRYRGEAGRTARGIGAPNKRAYGTGKVRGVVYYDENQDGQRQPGEKKLSGTELYLDGQYLSITDAAGEFLYPAVNVGEYKLVLANETLPLPYVLKDPRPRPISVSLRGTTYIEIPVTTLSD